MQYIYIYITFLKKGISIEIYNYDLPNDNFTHKISHCAYYN